MLAPGAIAILVTACSASGHNFNPGQLSSLVPGQTTMAQAAYALAAPAAQIYPQSDGTTLAMWSFHLTLIPDGLYSRKSATLQFGRDGRLMRLVDSTNILLEPWERQKLLGPAPLAENQYTVITVPADTVQIVPDAASLAVPVPQAPPIQAK